MTEHEIKVERTNEQTEVLAEFKNVDLKIDYLWDNHGKFVDWNEFVEESTFWPGVDGQLQKYTFTEHLLDRDFDFEVHQLIIDGKKISGDVLSHRASTDTKGKTTVYCRVIVGWG